MSDIVERLRESGLRSEIELHEDREEAAARIRELEAQVSAPVTVSEAARVLLNVFEDPDNYAPDDFDWQFLYGEMTADHKESLKICGVPDWPATLTVALRILAQENDDE